MHENRNDKKVENPPIEECCKFYQVTHRSSFAFKVWLRLERLEEEPVSLYVGMLQKEALNKQLVWAGVRLCHPLKRVCSGLLLGLNFYALAQTCHMDSLSKCCIITTVNRFIFLFLSVHSIMTHCSTQNLGKITFQTIVSSLLVVFFFF